jgi:hypothetical protein
MKSGLPLSEMTVEQKLQAMESLWDDLCSRSEDLPSPPWHGDILAEREAALASGEEAFEDWDVAKRKIREELK